MTILSRPSALVAAATFVGFLHTAPAQTVSVTSPAASTVFRPETDLAGPQTFLSEGIFTKLPFTVAAYGNIGYDDNLFLTHSGRQGSGLNSIGLNIGSHIGNQRTRLDALLSAGIIAYWNRPGDSIAPNLSLALNFTHQFNERTVFGFSTFTSYEQESDIAAGLNQSSNQGNFFFSTNTFTLGYWLTHRLSLITTYGVSTVLYDNSATALSNNLLQNSIGEQVRYLLLPTVNVALEYRFQNVTYFHADANYDSQFVLVGADATLSPRLNFGFRLGAEFRNQYGTFRKATVSPTFNSTLTYEYKPGSTVEWINQLGLGQPNTDSPGYSEFYQTGIKVTHRFGQKLKAVVALNYTYNKSTGNSGGTSTVAASGQNAGLIVQNSGFGLTVINAGPSTVVLNQGLGSFTENILDVSLGVSYQVTRPFSVNAGYTFTRDFSDQTATDYYRNRIYLGAQFAF